MAAAGPEHVVHAAHVHGFACTQLTRCLLGIGLEQGAQGQGRIGLDEIAPVHRRLDVAVDHGRLGRGGAERDHLPGARARVAGVEEDVEVDPGRQPLEAGAEVVVRDHAGGGEVMGADGLVAAVRLVAAHIDHLRAVPGVMEDEHVPPCGPVQQPLEPLEDGRPGGALVGEDAHGRRLGGNDAERVEGVGHVADIVDAAAQVRPAGSDGGVIVDTDQQCLVRHDRFSRWKWRGAGGERVPALFAGASIERRRAEGNAG